MKVEQELELEKEELEDAEEESAAPAREEGFKAWALRMVFETLMRSQGNKPGNNRFLAVGHSHLDAAWRWRVFQTRSKAKFTFRNALRHIDQYDFFTFTQSTPAFFEWMKDRQPRIFRAIQDAVKRGRWELVGGSWVEPDCNLPDGESLVRQRLYGQRFYLDHFGKVADIEWMPDTFGFCWTLPQILAKSGAKYFWTTKLLWNDTSKFPVRTFLWQSPDGTSVLSHISPLYGMDIQDFLRKSEANRPLKSGLSLTANYKTSPETIENYLDKNHIPEVMIAYGMGDGGGGPNEMEIEVIRNLRQAESLETGTAATMFERLEQWRDRLPVWNDELYLEYHRGCYTTHGRVKRTNRRLEIKLRNSEIIHTMNSLLDNTYPDEELREGWKTLCFHQFHDILPGSSIPEVYDDAYEEYEKLESSLDDLERDGLAGIARRINTVNTGQAGHAPLIVYNQLSWKRTGIVRLEVPPHRAVRVFDCNGTQVPSQPYIWGDRNFVSFIAPAVPDLGYRTYYLKEEIISPDAEPAEALPGTESIPEGYAAVEVEEKPDGSVVMSNEFVRVTVDADTGNVTSIIDRINNREMLDGPANELKLYRDASMVYPAWNIDPHYREKEIRIPQRPESMEIIDRGPVVGTVVVKGNLRRSPATREVRLFAGRPLVYFITAVDWHETKAILKASFNTAIKADEVTSEIPYGAINRATSPRNKFDKGRWEMSCHKWASLSDGRYGIALLNDGKYGFSADGGTLALTLLRGPLFPSAIMNAWGLSEPAADRPKYTDQGRHVMRYAIMPHSGDWRAARLWRAGQEFNNPLMSARTGHHEGMMPSEATSLSCDSETSYIAAIKRPEDFTARPDARYHQLVVRLVEAAGAEDTVRLTFHGPNLMIGDVREMDLLEFGSQPAGEVHEGTVALQMKPFEIKTIKVTLTVRRPEAE